MKALKIIGVLLLVIGLIIMLSVISHRKNEELKRQKELERQKPKIESTYHWKIEKTTRVYFTGEYGEIRRDVQPGDKVSFENASEPYCIHNKVKEYCSQGLEDVGTQMPNSTNNGELRFKSQNGNTGYIDIIFWIWVRN